MKITDSCPRCVLPPLCSSSFAKLNIWPVVCGLVSMSKTRLISVFQEYHIVSKAGPLRVAWGRPTYPMSMGYLLFFYLRDSQVFRHIYAFFTNQNRSACFKFLTIADHTVPTVLYVRMDLTSDQTVASFFFCFLSFCGWQFSSTGPFASIVIQLFANIFQALQLHRLGLLD